MSSSIRTKHLSLLIVFVAAVACAERNPVVPDDSPLAGLTQAAASDSGGTPVPPPATTPHPTDAGTFRGTVVGSEPAPVGTDTMATAPRLANVRVTAYPRLANSNSADPQVGPEAASVFTNANGAFELPGLPGGEYVVTFVPPQGSPYRGVYATATAHAGSGAHAWWVVLSKQ